MREVRAEIELLWDRPEVCLMCKGTPVVGYALYESAVVAKVLRFCEKHVVDTASVPPGMRRISLVELAELKSRSRFVPQDVREMYALGPDYPDKIDAYYERCAREGRPAVFIFNSAYAWTVAWFGFVDSAWTPEELAHARKLYDKLVRETKALASASPRPVDRLGMVRWTFQDATWSEVESVAQRVYEMESILRDEQLLEMSMVMDG